MGLSEDETLELHTRHHVRVLAVTQKRHIVGFIHIKACGDNYGAYFEVNFFGLLVKVNGLALPAGFSAFEAFNTVVAVDAVDEGTVWSKGTDMALRVPKLRSHSLGYSMGKRLCIPRSPCISQEERSGGFWRILTRKLPT